MMRTMVGWVVPLLAVAMLVGVVTWDSSARATVMVELALEDMARDAVAIVHGRVVRSSGHLAIDEGADPYTLTTLAVHEWVKGPGGDEVVLREIGGEIGRGGRGGMAIDGVPGYRIGEEVVVFLERDADGFYRTYGMVQGKFVVQHGVPGVPDTVVRDAEAVSFARWTDGQMTIERGTHTAMALETFLDAVATALRLAPPRIDTPSVDDDGVVR